MALRERREIAWTAGRCSEVRHSISQGDDDAKGVRVQTLTCKNPRSNDGYTN